MKRRRPPPSELRWPTANHKDLDDPFDAHLTRRNLAPRPPTRTARVQEILDALERGNGSRSHYTKSPVRP